MHACQDFCVTLVLYARVRVQPVCGHMYVLYCPVFSRSQISFDMTLDALSNLMVQFESWERKRKSEEKKDSSEGI